MWPSSAARIAVARYRNGASGSCSKRGSSRAGKQSPGAGASPDGHYTRSWKRAPATAGSATAPGRKRVPELAQRPPGAPRASGSYCRGEGGGGFLPSWSIGEPSGAHRAGREHRPGRARPAPGRARGGAGGAPETGGTAAEPPGFQETREAGGRSLESRYTLPRAKARRISLGNRQVETNHLRQKGKSVARF